MASIIIPDVAAEPSMAVAATAAAPKILPSTLLDVEAYSARYSGETKLQRLVHIAQMASSATSVSGPQPEVAVQAYQLAERHLKQTGNLRRYLQIFGPQRDATVPTSIVFDETWMEEMEAKARAAREVLCSRLSAAQSHLHKDAIRSAHLALAEHDRHFGDEFQALRSVLQSKDYCTSRNQTAQVCVLVLELALTLRSFGQVRDFVTKTEHTLQEQYQQQQLQQQQQQQQQNSQGSGGAAASSPPSSSRTITVPGLANKIKIASGLERLAMGDYNEAARKFSSVSWSNSSDLVWNTVTAPEDVATYAGLLSLATASRSQLIELTESAKDGLELVPPIRDALRHYGRAEYKACWQLLSSNLLPQLEWDLHLRPHLQMLYQQIMEKCLMEYVRPYQRVSLDDMKVDLGLDPGAAIEETLVRLIGNGQLTYARLDTRAKVLIRQWNDEELAQRQAQKRMAKLGRRVLDDAHAMIIRWACVDYDLIVRAERSRGTLPHASSPSRTTRSGRRAPSNNRASTAAAVAAAVAHQHQQQHRSLMIHDDDDDDDDSGASENDDVDDVDIAEQLDLAEDAEIDAEQFNADADIDDANMMEQHAEQGAAAGGEDSSQQAIAAGDAATADMLMADANQ